MSTSNLYKLYKTKTTEIAEFSNGWGSAPVLWSYIGVKFLKWEGHEWLGGNNEALWNIASDINIPTCLRITHAFTFDRSYCPINKILDLSKACQETYTITHKENYINHWGNIAQKLIDTKIDKKCIGIALSCTSVNDQWISSNGQDIINLFQIADLEKN